MQCPRCGSTKIWHDMTASGCKPCGYMITDDGPSFLLARPGQGLASSVNEMRDRGQISSFHSYQETDDDCDE